MAYTAINTGFANTLIKNVAQVTHGFIVGDIVRFNGTIYVAAQADTFLNSQAIGLVTNVADANNFTITVSGYVSSLAGLTPGDLYYLDAAVAAGVTTTAPVAVGEVVRPVYIAISATEAIVMYWAGDEIEPPASSFTWNTVAGTSQAMLADNGYIPQNVALTTFTLPATASLGETFRIAGRGAGGWAVAQNAGQTIYLGNVNTTTGVGGSLASTNRGDCFELVCIATDTDFVMISSMGNITYV
jgi:hypothetical protein